MAPGPGCELYAHGMQLMAPLTHAPGRCPQGHHLQFRYGRGLGVPIYRNLDWIKCYSMKLLHGASDGAWGANMGRQSSHAEDACSKPAALVLESLDSPGTDGVVLNIMAAHMLPHAHMAYW